MRLGDGSSMKKTFKVFSCLGLAGLLLAAIMIGVAAKSLDLYARRAGPLVLDVELEIHFGSNLRSVVASLEKVGVIDDKQKFYYYLRYLSGKAQGIQAGYYVFPALVTPREVVEMLQDGKNREIRVTIPEGVTKKEIATIIWEAGISEESQILQAMEEENTRSEFLVPKIGAGGQTTAVPGGIEGYLFPDTYSFEQGVVATVVLRRMRERLNDVITKDMVARMKEMGWSLHQVLTLASIVEKEVSVPWERKKIASVYHNRLNRKMRLQADPTVIYGLKDFRGSLKKRDLRTRHPYNTYVYGGLPPGPIASPGRDAIRSVLWPDETRFLYFVARNDGTHEFCETLKCHNRAVHKWQIKYFRQKRHRTSS